MYVLQRCLLSITNSINQQESWISDKRKVIIINP